MNFKEALNLTEDMSHRDEYSAIVIALGYENVKSCIPFSFEKLKESYEKDRHFNTDKTPIKSWDLAAGFNCEGSKCILVRSRLTNLYREKCGVDTFSCSDGVCILKECARMWIEEEGYGKR